MRNQTNEDLLVFIVDDDEDDRFFLEKAFLEHPAPCRLSEFGNGQELIDFLVNNPDERLPDLLVLDLNMPMLDGFSTLEQIKHHERWWSIPVAILTTSNNPDDEVICRQLGADAFFVKPPVYPNLIRIVEQSIDKLIEKP